MLESDLLTFSTDRLSRMDPASSTLRFLALVLTWAAPGPLHAAEAPATPGGAPIPLTGRLLPGTGTTGQDQIELRFGPSPATEEYSIQFSPGVNEPFLRMAGATNGFGWTGPVLAPSGFFRVEPRQLSTNELLATTLLHRIAYGPTPDELDRVRQMGSDAYLAEQLAGETVTENLDTVDPTPRWQKVTVTGLGSSSRLYLYLDGAGDVYLDDFRLVAGASDDGSRPNLLRNG